MSNALPDPGSLVVGADSASVMQQAAARVAEVLADAVAIRGVATMALAGGNTPRQLYRLLSGSPHAESIPWGQVRLFLGDERWVPTDHPQSNARMVRESLLAALPEPPEFFPMPTDLADTAEAAQAYRDALAREAPPETEGGLPRLDLLLLGMGDDGHTASLFPGTRILDARETVAAVFVPRLAAWRLSLTLPVLNAARHVLFLVTGADKAPMLARVIGEGPCRTLPASLVKPEDGVLAWYVDRAAAARLEDHSER